MTREEADKFMKENEGIYMNAVGSNKGNLNRTWITESYMITFKKGSFYSRDYSQTPRSEDKTHLVHVWDAGEYPDGWKITNPTIPATKLSRKLYKKDIVLEKDGNLYLKMKGVE